MQPKDTILSGQAWHPMMARATHDDLARQQFVSSLMNELQGGMAEGNALVWEKRVRASFVAKYKREPANGGEVRKALMDQPFTQAWSSLKRCAREMSYESVGPMVERELPNLIERARRLRGSSRKLGSLEFNPDLKMPRYMTDIENHAKPGGYYSTLTDDDVFAGAEYDRTFFLTGIRPALLAVKGEAAPIARNQKKIGGYGPYGDDMGAAMAQWLKTSVPEMKPRKILDMGCTVGHSTLGWVDAFPEAEVHAIDVAGPCIRYGHARAEALGRKVHFSQQDAEFTTYADQSFDLVVSHLLLHELTFPSIHGIFAESHRLLKPGGVMMHMDVAPGATMDLLSQCFQLDWNAHFNAEPFLTKLMELDLGEVARKGGFAVKNTFHAYAPSTVKGSSVKYHFFGAHK